MPILIPGAEAEGRKMMQGKSWSGKMMKWQNDPSSLFDVILLPHQTGLC